MLERALERYLVERVRHKGGLCWKFVSPGTAGVPDRIVLMDGRAIFVELKQQGERPRPLQKKRHRELERLGFAVYVIDSKDQVDRFIGILSDAV